MAVRQYVGARYVPKFYQNSTDPSSTQWEGNRSYEAMVVVTYNNDSYTSKIPVPAGIGNPASNPTYWARTGNYNGQVEQYRQDVESSKTDLTNQMNTLKSDTEQSVQQVQEQTNELQSNLTTEIEDRKSADDALTTNINNLTTDIAGLKSQDIDNPNAGVILIGDSWGTGYGEPHGWIYHFQQRLKTQNVHSAAHNGSGFVATGDHSTVHTFLYLLQSLDAEITDKNSITHIIVGGGLNDSTKAGPTVVAAAKAFVDYVKTTYPNATVYIIACNRGLFNTSFSEKGDYVAFYNDVDGYDGITHSLDTHKDVTIDNFNSQWHCVENGYIQCANAMYNAIKGYKYSPSLAQITRHFENTEHGLSNLEFNFYQSDGLYYLQIPTINDVFEHSQSGQYHKLQFTCTDDVMFPNTPVWTLDQLLITESGQQAVAHPMYVALTPQEKLITFYWYGGRAITYTHIQNVSRHAIIVGNV